MCTISAIDCDMGWYYLSCKVCSKKVIHVLNENSDDEDDDSGFTQSFYCVKCKVNNPKLVPRYKLHMIVRDNTGNSKLMLFDNLAFQLINLPCLELVGPICEEIQELGDLPLPITNLVGQTYLFKVVIEKDNYLYKHDTYKVEKIITNKEVISEFDPNYVSTRTESLDLTPLKRRGLSLINLEEVVDQNSILAVKT
ncbi:hypothetical protein BRARA_K01422 [Brassica rapa]|uniref:Replication factor A C-terminal domain-containing protein n=1 Tax=Brassica campestris TaxID=3711 RepID=A0A397KVY1_BRACM|nr:hypothetical protein BRARA_K01422 [Brassica rapa]